MGIVIGAKCNCCKYEKEKILFGASMAETGQCFVPALRNGSAIMESKDIRNGKNHSDYIFYTDQLFFKQKFSGSYDAWEFKLMKKYNLCPSCKEYEMDFICLGNYD